MPTVNISLPDTMRTYVEEETKNGGYSSVSEYMRALIREDQRRKTQERIENQLLEGLRSGEAQQLDSAQWESLRRQVQRRLGERGDREG